MVIGYMHPFIKFDFSCIRFSTRYRTERIGRFGKWAPNADKRVWRRFPLNHHFWYALCIFVLSSTFQVSPHALQLFADMGRVRRLRRRLMKSVRSAPVGISSLLHLVANSFSNGSQWADDGDQCSTWHHRFIIMALLLLQAMYSILSVILPLVVRRVLNVMTSDSVQVYTTL